MQWCKEEVLRVVFRDIMVYIQAVVILMPGIFALLPELSSMNESVANSGRNNVMLTDVKRDLPIDKCLRNILAEPYKARTEKDVYVLYAPNKTNNVSQDHCSRVCGKLQSTVPDLVAKKLFSNVPTKDLMFQAHLLIGENFTSVDGKPLNLTAMNDASCVTYVPIVSNPQVVPAKCFAEKYFICEYGQKVKVNRNAKSWFEARAYCVANGGDLLTNVSKINNITAMEYFIGFSRLTWRLISSGQVIDPVLSKNIRNVSKERRCINYRRNSIGSIISAVTCKNRKRSMYFCQVDITNLFKKILQNISVITIKPLSQTHSTTRDVTEVHPTSGSDHTETTGVCSRKSQRGGGGGSPEPPLNNLENKRELPSVERYQNRYTTNLNQNDKNDLDTTMVDLETFAKINKRPTQGGDHTDGPEVQYNNLRSREEKDFFQKFSTCEDTTENVYDHISSQTAATSSCDDYPRYDTVQCNENVNFYSLVIKKYMEREYNKDEYAHSNTFSNF